MPPVVSDTDFGGNPSDRNKEPMMSNAVKKSGVALVALQGVFRNIEEMRCAIGEFVD